MDVECDGKDTLFLVGPYLVLKYPFPPISDWLSPLSLNSRVDRAGVQRAGPARLRTAHQLSDSRAVGNKERRSSLTINLLILKPTSHSAFI